MLALPLMLWDILRLKSAWTTHIKTRRKAAFVAILAAVLAIPLDFISTDVLQRPELDLPFAKQLALSLLMTLCSFIVVPLLAGLASRGRHALLMLAGVLTGSLLVEAVLVVVLTLAGAMGMAPVQDGGSMVSTVVVLASMVWALVILAFVLKTAGQLKPWQSLLMVVVIFTCWQLVDILGRAYVMQWMP